MTPDSELPFIDEHSVEAKAGIDAVWSALGESLGRRMRSGWFTALLGATPRRSHGDPLVEGSALPGFAVRSAVPGRELVLAGRHRFSAYVLRFGLEDDGGRTRLTARSSARFPGPHGRLYRAAVIGSGAHRVVVRRWLEQIAGAAEARERGR